MKALMIGVLAVGAFAAGVSAAVIQPDRHAAHHAYTSCTFHHGQRTCHKASS